jgi:hypothetical protein
LPENEHAHLSRNAGRLYLPILVILIAAAATAVAQTSPEIPYYARINTFGIFSAYSGNSSHILLGKAENRMLFDVGVSYNRRLLLNRKVNWQYSGELLPVALESDPMGYFVNHQTAPTVETFAAPLSYPEITCSPSTFSYNDSLPNPDGSTTTYSGTETITCSGRRWTIGEAISPIGMQWNFMPRHRLQPVVIGHGGYMYSTQPIPISGAGSFNFTFDLGAGFELYRSSSKSIRTEYRYHHISNHGTAYANPGIDNGLFQVTYSIGR